MAMQNAAISTFEFIGDSTPCVFSPVMKLAAMEREGVDGYELYEVGERCDPVEWTTFADCVDAGSLIGDYLAISGTLQTVTNVDGSTVASVAVEFLGAVAVPMVKSVGGLSSGGTQSVQARWRLQASV